MHKKDQVKKVIEKYIKKGRDFFELTPSFLANLDELKGFSERTLKRGRTEYKNDHQDILKKHSKDTANSKKKISKILEKDPDITPKALTNALPGIDPKLIFKTRTLWKKDRQPVKKEGTNGSLRKNVFDFLNKKPKTTLSILEEAFPDDNKKTISNYLDQWRKEKPSSKPMKSSKQKVMAYLDQNPETRLNHLKEVFPEVKPASISTYHSLWKSHQPTAKFKQTLKRPASAKATGTTSGTKVEDVIQALNNTIDAQQKTIEVLKSQNQILKDKQLHPFTELEGMSQSEVRQVEKVIKTFIKGVKRI